MPLQDLGKIQRFRVPKVMVMSTSPPPAQSKRQSKGQDFHVEHDLIVNDARVTMPMLGR